MLFEFWTRLQKFRAANGEPGFWDYLRIGGLSLASLTGIPQIIEAIRGQRLLTGVPLSAQQRWELGIGGVVQLVLVAVGVRAFWRRFRTVEAPVPKPMSLAEWKPGDPLPAFDKAAIDPAKFNRYSMDPTNVNNGGKWKAFEQLGYNVSDDAARTNAAADVISQLRAQLARTPAKQGSNTNFGQRFEVRTPIKGPNGKTGTLVTVWQFDQGSTTPRLITN